MSFDRDKHKVVDVVVKWKGRTRRHDGGEEAAVRVELFPKERCTSLLARVSLLFAQIPEGRAREVQLIWGGSVIPEDQIIDREVRLGR